MVELGTGIEKEKTEEEGNSRGSHCAQGSRKDKESGELCAPASCAQETCVAKSRGPMKRPGKRSRAGPKKSSMRITRCSAACDRIQQGSDGKVTQWLARRDTGRVSRESGRLAKAPLGQETFQESRY